MSADTIVAKMHNLVKLAEHTRLNLTGEHKIFLDEVNDFNLEARYPQFKNEFNKDNPFVKKIIETGIRII